MEDKAKNLYEYLTEDFVEPAANFYMTSENREKFYALWGQFKKTLAGYTCQSELVITEPKKRPDLVFPTEYYESEPQEQSRSIRRRVAAQKGEPAPDFSKQPEPISSAQTGESIISNASNPEGRSGYSQPMSPWDKVKAIAEYTYEFVHRGGSL